MMPAKSISAESALVCEYGNAKDIILLAVRLDPLYPVNVGYLPSAFEFPLPIQSLALNPGIPVTFSSFAIKLAPSNSIFIL